MSIFKNTLALFICFSIVSGNWYKNKLMIYIDNYSNNITINKNQITTSNESLNKVLKNEKAKRIFRWLPHAKLTDRDKNIFLNRYYIIEFSESNNLEKKIETFNKVPFINSAEKISIIKNHYRPNDMFYDLQYAISQTNAVNAYNFWNIDSGETPGQIEDNEIIVAINDYPLMWYHPDLIDNVWLNLGEDADGDGVLFENSGDEWFLDSGDINNIDDDNDGYIDNLIGWNAHSNNGDLAVNLGLSHGTNVGGCISSMTNNEYGIASIGWSIKIMGITNCDPSGSITSGYEGILTAAQMGADIINNSWGSSGGPDYAEALINTVLNQYECIIVASAGNGGANIANYPAAFEGVLSVTSTSEGSIFSCWATRHETVDIAAPGDNIFTTTTSPNEGGFFYNYATGTSFSAPIVSGALGLLKSVYPEGDRSFLISKVKNGADYFNDMDGDCNGENLSGFIGAGELNIRQAILEEISPEIIISNINVLTETGYVSPGDTTEIVLDLTNTIGSSPIQDITVYLSTESPQISIIDGQYTSSQVLPSGNSIDALFIITSTNNMSYGNIPFNVTISANPSGNFPSNLGTNIEPYGLETEIRIPFGSSQQYGYPIENVTVKKPPLLYDLDNNSLPEIYFSSDSILYGTMIAGLENSGFPFHANSKITTTCSAADINNNGNNDLVFGTESGTLYMLNHNGNILFSYTQEDTIVGFPSLSDIDNDGFLDIVFIAKNNLVSKVYALNYLGEELDNFPVTIEEKIITGSAIADINLNNFAEIIFGTLEGSVYVLDHQGNIQTGFPATSTFGINQPPTVLNLNQDQYLEFLITDLNGNIYSFDYNGSIITQTSINSPILSSLSIADLNRDGEVELIFFDSDNNIHALSFNLEESLGGWPINLNSVSYSEPIIIDVDNDNDLEIISTTDIGEVHIIHHDGSFYNNFPYISQDSIFSTPSIGDLDNDGDCELIFGTSQGLNVLDINESSGNQYSWSAYRGNSMRNGYFNIELSEMSSDRFNIPLLYSLENNFPNPFNPTTRIDYSIPINSDIKLTIYDLLGNKVKTLIDNKYQSAGFKTIKWNGTNEFGAKTSSGVYFYALKAGNFYQTKKMILIK